MTRDDGDGREARGDRGDTDDRNESRSAALAAGVALFNAGHVLAARGLWETTRTAVVDDDPDADGDDDTEHDEERVLRGLAAVATAVDRAGDVDRSDAADHAIRALNRLEGIDEGCHGIALEPVHEWCRRLAADPDTGDTDPPPIRIHSVAVGFADLDLDAALTAAPALAAAVDAGDEGTLSAATELAREEHGTGRTRVTELVFAYLLRPEARPQIAARIGDHVDRDRREQRDVSRLFD